MRFGMHVSTAPGLKKLADYAADIGAESYQIFVDSPSTWSYGDYDPDEAAAFRERRAELDQGPLVVHTGYLINLASAKNETIDKAKTALAKEFAKAALVGADYLVLHPGKHTGRGRRRGLELIVQGLDEVLASLDDAHPLLLLENSEGSGTALGVDFTELQALLEGLEERGRRAGICLDTAHLWGAGYDLSSRQSTRAVIDEFDETIGLERLHCFHLNDSLKELDSRTDRHAYLGEGNIGLEAFRELVNDERIEHCAMILEKTGENKDHSRRLINELKALRRE
jgi:deoxyribonuclease-4